MHKVFQLHVFPQKFEFYVGKEEAASYKKANGIEEHKLMTGCTCHASIYIAEPKLLCVAAHEIFHASCNICNTFGIADEETQAYIIQYMFDKYLQMVGVADKNGICKGEFGVEGKHGGLQNRR